ncbi:hypothetical protein NCLIV_000800 [Neospora caninum Liverpool]|uniref:phosphoethanolamine N-methyltransferase n=1 Tax=Neospora caninum (strain Liverpool) TaxID=572307 RepID=F0V795_NEOCL|nr:hypothetical protein NCLIV_000800 [Neospora caninum Liverpool]CBZ49586.1 hypothetical protein NCLIV_000800 [Neospora caninum Liverpool]|eukprot:XP_003879621.1 hypothetical protein NCLIV_000800 [Neospora caninum Liverpool]
MKLQTIVLHDPEQEREVTSSLLLQSHRPPTGNECEAFQIADDALAEKSARPRGGPNDYHQDEGSYFTKDYVQPFRVEQVESKEKSPSSSGMCRTSAGSIWGVTQDNSGVVLENVLRLGTVNVAQKPRDESKVTEVDAFETEKEAKFTSSASNHVGADRTERHEPPSANVAENPREKFRGYWQCALNKFGLTNEGMLLKQDACKQGFSNADAQEVINLVMQHTVDALLKKESSSSHSPSASLHRVEQSGTREKQGNLPGAGVVDTWTRCSVSTCQPKSCLSISSALPLLLVNSEADTDLLGIAKRNVEARVRDGYRQLANIQLVKSDATTLQPHRTKGTEQNAMCVSWKDEICGHDREKTLLRRIPGSHLESVPLFGHVLELGAGIGRLTRLLQEFATQVVAVDFVDEYVRANRDANGRSHCRSGGFVFLRESCGEPSDKGKQSRNWALGGNPTVYRRAETYTQWIHDVAEETGTVVQLLLSAHPVRLYQQANHTDSQCCWFLRIKS